jgi:hypothetical protein
MARFVKDFIDIKNHGSLDTLIEQLAELRASLPADSDAQVRMRGDDVFGRTLSISFQRLQTAEEAACDARYAEAYAQSREREVSRLQEELGVDSAAAPRTRRLRMVA